MLMLTASLAISSCNYYHTEYPEPGKEETDELSLRNVARILSELPLGSEQLREVADAVSSSSVNGYDEEYDDVSFADSPFSIYGKQEGSYQAPKDTEPYFPGNLFSNQ